MKKTSFSPNQNKSNMHSVASEEYTKYYVSKKRVKFYHNTNYSDFTSNFNHFHCLSMNWNEKLRFGSWGISVFVLSYFRPIYGGWWANWFKLISSPPNLQPKRKVFVSDFKYVSSNISYFFYMMIVTSLKDTRRHICVWSKGCKKSIPQSWKS